PNFLGYVIPRPILPAIQEALAATGEQTVLVKFILPTYVMGLVLAGPIAGYVLEQGRYKIVLILSAIAFVLLGSSGYFLSNLDLLVGSRFLTGIAAGILNVTAITMAGDLFDAKQRARIIGMIAAGGSLAAVVSSPISGAVGNANWHVAFLLHGLALPIAICA